MSRKKEHLDEKNFHQSYGNEVLFLKSYLIIAMFKVFSRQLRGTLTAAIQRYFTVEDFTEMNQHAF